MGGYHLPIHLLCRCIEEAAAAGVDDDATTVEFVQRGYLALEKQGKVYRIDPNVLPTKFMNATLNLEEVRKMPFFCAICGTVHEKIILVYQGRLGTKIG